MTPDAAAGRAEQCWRALQRCLVSEGPRVLVVDPGRGPAAAWPTSQVLVAALLHGRLTGSFGPAIGLLQGLDRFAKGEAYADAPRGWRSPRRVVYYDDNAWLGLAGQLARHLGVDVGDLPERMLRVVASGEADGGGIHWRVGDPSRNACSTGPGGSLGAWSGSPAGLAMAMRCSEFLRHRLMNEDGLIADHVRADGSVEPTVWSYNQGSAIHLELLLARRGADPEGVARARTHATRTVEWYGSAPERLWREPPAFVAVLARALAALQHDDPGGEWTGALGPYLDRAWASARRPDGLMTGGGIGRYDAGTALDQAAFVQMYALRADPSLAALVT